VSPDVVFDDFVLTNSIEVPDEIIPALGHLVGMPIDCYAKKTKSLAELLDVEPKTSYGKTKKIARAKKK
jgi:hypothetical protein